jgi:hypothetical protein
MVRSIYEKLAQKNMQRVTEPKEYSLLNVHKNLRKGYIDRCIILEE